MFVVNSCVPGVCVAVVVVGEGFDVVVAALGVLVFAGVVEDWKLENLSVVVSPKFKKETYDHVIQGVLYIVKLLFIEQKRYPPWRNYHWF